MYGSLLGIICKGCGHRGVKDERAIRGIYRGNMKELRELKLRCDNCGAHGTGPELWDMYLPQTRPDARYFLSGQDGFYKANL